MGGLQGIERMDATCTTKKSDRGINFLFFSLRFVELEGRDLGI